MPKATACISTPNHDLESLREYKIARQLKAAGLRLERAPSHLPEDGFRIYSGHQILAGNSYGLTLDQIESFAKRAGILR